MVPDAAGPLETSDGPVMLLRTTRPNLERWPPAPSGNQRALKHGTTAERAVSPLRQRWLLALRDRWGEVPEDVELTLQATRLARLELAYAWGGRTRGRAQQARSGLCVPGRAEKWSAAAAERTFAAWRRRESKGNNARFSEPRSLTVRATRRGSSRSPKILPEIGVLPEPQHALAADE